MVCALLSLMGVAFAQGVVILDQGEDAAEDRFQEELALSLDEVLVRQSEAGFATATLATQLETVRPILAEQAFGAVAWLGLSDPQKLLVSVAFVQSDRAVVRLLDVPRGEDAPVRLALAVRELISSAYASETAAQIPTLPAPSGEQKDSRRALTLRGSVGGVLPVHVLAGGARLLLGSRLGTQIGSGSLGLALTGQLGDQQWRLGPALDVQLGPIVVGGDVQWTDLQWRSQLQPRLFVGFAHAPEDGPNGEVRLKFAPLRDQISKEETDLYDTGWIEIEFLLGWSRNIFGG